ncbi:MAG: Gfo/Idh/MocA family oxidoreductase [Anaerolineae bacterium]|nr:Gfo/Idh/MocA family oxidoreductase [Anaerolineae bacterium]
MTLRVGIIGCGLMGQQHARGYLAASELAHVVTCCDDRLEAAQQAAALFNNGVQVTTDWEEVIANPDIDAVSICTPHYLHRPQVIAATQAGKHVLLEKPMALNLAEARSMVAAAEAAGITYMIAQNQRYLPEHWRIKELLNEGSIGRVFAARIDGNQMLSAIYPPGHWLFRKVKSGGGVIRTTAIHKLDLMRYLLGEIKRVNAVHRISGLNPEMDCEDVAAMTLEFENGAIGDAFFTFASPRAPIPTASHELTVLYGEQGMIHNVGGWFMTHGREVTNLGLPDADFNATFLNEVRHFLECVRDGREPLSSGRNNLGTMAVIEAMYQSAEQGCAVEVAV